MPRWVFLLLVTLFTVICTAQAMQITLADSSSLTRSTDPHIIVKRGAGHSDSTETCPGEEDEEQSDYNLGLHIGALFIIVCASLIGSLSPVVISFLRTKWGSNVLLLGRTFGGGTILATAFIHMLPPAMASLGSACLSETWTSFPFASFFTMVGIIGMQLIQFSIVNYFHRMAKCSHSHELVTRHDSERGNGKVADSVVPAALLAAAAAATVAPAKSPEEAHSPSHNHNHSDDRKGSLSLGHCQDRANLQDQVDLDGCIANGPHDPHHHFHSHHPALITDVAQRRTAVYLLEIGVAIHSIIIGISVGVTSGNQFVALLIAVCFHQLFEGLALGSTVVDAKFASKTVTLLLVLIYGVTTPLGVGIGIAIRESYSENSTTTLITQGIFDALSAGILIYTALVEIITPELTDSAELRSRGRAMRYGAYIAFWLGAGLMSLLGLWA